MELEGAVALVTGAAGGIASKTVERLAGAGCDIVAVDVDRAEAEKIASAVEAKGRRGVAIEADLVDAAAVERAVARALEELGRIDVLVNAVGVGGVAEIPGHPEDLWDRILGINLKSVFLICREVLPHMTERGSGRIVTVTSRAAYQSSGGTAAYAASKGGLLAFTRVLAVEAGPYGVTVNNVAPGTTLTPMTKDFYGGPDGYREEATRSGVVVEPKRLVSPDEIAGAVLYLCGPESDYITGTTIHVNGGSFIP
jgi:3-oxoacyl-[acyl-carrier protein] reductase